MDAFPVPFPRARAASPVPRRPSFPAGGLGRFCERSCHTQIPKARWARAFAHSFRLRRVPLVGRDRTYFLAMPRARRKAANGKANGAAGALLLLFGAFCQSIEVVWRARSLTTAGRFTTLVQVSIEVTSCRCLHRGASRLLCTHALANAAQRLSSSDYLPSTVLATLWPALEGDSCVRLTHTARRTVLNTQHRTLHSRTPTRVSRQRAHGSRHSARARHTVVCTE